MPELRVLQDTINKDLYKSFLGIFPGRKSA